MSIWYHLSTCHQNFKWLHWLQIVLWLFCVWHYFCPPWTFDFGDEINNFPKSTFSKKNTILAVWVYAFDWKFYTTIWHYLAILCQIFRVVSLFLTDWEHVSWVTFFFFAHLVLQFYPWQASVAGCACHLQ